MILLALPMVVDASTHMVSNMAGLGQGFRYSNDWLAALIGDTVPASTYVGDALGSFNSWLRLLTGTLFAVGLTFFAVPHLGATYEAQADAIRTKLRTSRTAAMTAEDPIRVLLADDHLVVRAGIRQFLEAEEGITVIAEADDGEQAVDLIEQLQPDVAVLDIRMPKKTGVEVTRWVRTHQRSTGVLILTAFDDDAYVLAVLKAGANGYVLKTADGDEIVQAVRAVHEGKSALDPDIARKVMSRVSDRSYADSLEELTSREHEVLTLVAQGYTNKAIGVQLGISDRTVQGHLAKIFGKLHASSRTEAVMRAVASGWLAPDLGELSEE